MYAFSEHASLNPLLKANRIGSETGRKSDNIMNMMHMAIEAAVCCRFCKIQTIPLTRDEVNRTVEAGDWDSAQTVLNCA